MLDDRHVGILIGDVSGKGIPAALYMARLMSDFRFYVQKYNQPKILLEKLNDLLVDRSRHGMFVTLQFALVDIWTGDLVHGDAGHLPMIRLREGKAEPMQLAIGPPLGIMKQMPYGDNEVRLAPGDILLFYTDGIIEAKNSCNKEFTMQRLIELLNRSWASASQVVEECLHQLSLFTQSSPQNDDITLVAFQWNKEQSMS